MTSACAGGEQALPSADDACRDTPATVLGVGEHRLLDAAAARGCVVLPAASGGGAEHLVVFYSASGLQVSGGVSAEVSVAAGAPRMAVSPPAAGRAAPADAAQAFHAMLRALEHAPPAAPRPVVPRLGRPPVPGDQRVFSVCASLDCSTFASVAARARFVGAHTAIFLDEEVPAAGLTDQDVLDLGRLFEEQIFPLDTLAFGRESDLDGNGVVILLLTDQVNALSGTCGNGTILGYFSAIDLLPGTPGSNGGEVLYSRVPDAATPSCRSDRDRVLRTLPPNLAHELQHLISFSRRVVAGSGAAEHVWLNEALSHFAEELGGRLIPDGSVQGGAVTRQAQFLELDFTNAMAYLQEPEAAYLVSPGASLGSSSDRGAQWLFLRWVADHVDPGDVTATQFTRRLVAGPEQGAENVAARAGRPFGELIGEWQLAAYLDDMPGFVPGTIRLSYTSINLRATLAQLFPVYPLRPDSITTDYRWSGRLRGGSGKHVRVSQAPDGGRVVLQLGDATSPPGEPPAILEPMVAVVRLR